MDLIDRWHQHLRDDALPPEAFLQRVVDAGVRYGDRPLCVYRRPHFLSSRAVRNVGRVLALFHQTVRRAREALERDGLDGRPGSLASRLCIPPEALALAAIDPGYDSAAVLARVDCFMAGEHPWLLELNAESPTGMAYADALSDLFRQDPLMDRFPGLLAMPSGDALVRELVRTWRSWSGEDHAPEVAIVDTPGQPTAPEFELFRRRFEALGTPCRVLGPAELDFDGTRLSSGGRPIDLVYRRILVADILADPEGCAPLLDAYAAGAVCVVNSLRTALLHTKGIFALLHEPAFQARLNPAQRRLVREHVPWTTCWAGDEREDHRRMALAEQDQLVLKPMEGYGGQGITLGWLCDRPTWERALESADAHVLQRRVPGQRVPFPDATEGYALRERLLDVDPFLVRGRLSGMLCRLSPNHLSNVRTGASQVPVFIHR